jgi:hypothetical protein
MPLDQQSLTPGAHGHARARLGVFIPDRLDADMTVMITGIQPGMTQEMYDGMSPKLLPILAQRPGFIAHMAWSIPGGFQVVEIWESEADHDAWEKEFVLPSLPPEMAPMELRFQPLHNFLTAHRS